MEIRSKIRLRNDATLLKEDWWSWSVWLDGPDEALDQVESVRYTLHPTFPEPIRVVTDRASRFKLRSEGWGEFTIQALVITTQGESLALERWITFSPAQDKTTSPRRPRIFISSSAIDKPVVSSLRRHVEEQGVEVLAAEDVKATDSWLQSANEAVRDADLVAFVTSGELRGFAEEELAQARANKKKIVPILLGSSTKPPSEFSEVETVQLESAEQIGSVADLLVARVKDEFYEDE
jgi:pYEATS domain-containing protein involved in immunity/TIR domain-containing protein